MKLSKYLDENEKKWNDDENANAEKMMDYLEKHIDVDLYKMAKTDDKVKAFRNLEGWLFNFYPDEFLEGLAQIGCDFQEYQRRMIYAFILSVTRNKPNIDVIYGMLTSKGIIDKMLVYEGDVYKIVTRDFGEIRFRKADGVLSGEVRKYLEKLGEQVVDGCHEIAFFLIGKDPSLKAVTGVCTKGLNCKFYHSFVLDGDDVIDLTANLIMPKDEYYLLGDVQELNVVNYEEYLAEAGKSAEFDESGTLYELLRCALYKQFLAR